jgi:single-strand DNA-binding protein
MITPQEQFAASYVTSTTQCLAWLMTQSPPYAKLLSIYERQKVNPVLNKVILIGRLATNPELKYTPSGVAVANFRLAVGRNRTNSEGERDTDFIDIVAWRQSAEFAANYLHTGRKVSVDGRLQIRNWVAQDGTKRRSAEVVVNDLQALDAPKGSARDDMENEDQDTSFSQPEPLARRQPALVTGDVDMQPEEHDFNDPFAD